MSSSNPVALLVEDESLIRMALEADLETHGFEVIAVGSGSQALAVLDTDADRLRAVITDVRLGMGPDGWDVARRARELVTDMPVVYVTGDSAHEWSAMGVPNSVLITKPFVAAQIIMAVVNLMTEVGAQRAASATATDPDAS